MNHETERYLAPVRERGKEVRKQEEKEKKTDHRLLPLNKYEVMHAKASHMNGLKDVSSSIPRVKEFLSRQNEKSTSTPEDKLQKVFKEHKKHLPDLMGDTGRKNKGEAPLTNEELENLTRYLLYLAENKSPEIDILVVLPQQHRMIGEDNRVYYKTFIQLHDV